MILGALIDAGVPLDDVRAALGTLAFDPDAVWTERVSRAGVTATKFCVRGEDVPREPGTGGQHVHPHVPEHAQPHDSWPDRVDTAVAAAVQDLLRQRDRATL